MSVNSRVAPHKWVRTLPVTILQLLHPNQMTHTDRTNSITLIAYAGGNAGAEGVSVVFFSALIFCFDLLRVIYVQLICSSIKIR